LNLKVGDVVELKSGSPKMTIGRFLPKSQLNDGVFVDCVWYENGQFTNHSFVQEALVLVSEN